MSNLIGLSLLQTGVCGTKNISDLDQLEEISTKLLLTLLKLKFCFDFHLFQL